MAENLDDGEFWLPPQFLADDDVAVTPFEAKFSTLQDDAVLFPSEFPYGFSSFELGSPVGFHRWWLQRDRERRGGAARRRVDPPRGSLLSPSWYQVCGMLTLFLLIVRWNIEYYFGVSYNLGLGLTHCPPLIYSILVLSLSDVGLGFFLMVFSLS
ncbi:hypothetical protein E2542_SST08803 [Spatholobus suberectus]|nr:hypothetical protein E2542_SST08803 [Spatholobus suberectus]